MFFHPQATSESTHGNYIFLKPLFRAVKAPVHTNLGGTIWGFQNVWIRVNTVRARTVLKSPWILGEVLEESLNSIFPWKVLKYLCKSLKIPWIFFNFKCGRLESVFWCSLVVQDRIIINHSSEKLKVIYTKCIFTQSASYMRIQFLPDGSLFVLIITNKVVIKKKKMFYAIINYQFKTSELKNVEKLVKQTVQALKAY